MTIKPVYETKIQSLPVQVYRSNKEMGQATSDEAARVLTAAIEARGEANAILATGNSQLTFLAALRQADLDWSRITLFHMDEYLGIDPNHPASFPLFLQRKLVDDVHPKAFYPLSTQNGTPEEICRKYELLLRGHPADLCALGIGENGHLAFNDPPFADFNDPAWVKVIELDPASRRQQVGEGHFASLDEVPRKAITLTIPALLAAKRVLAIVPEGRKAEAVYRTLYEPIMTAMPATILRETPYATLYLDADSAAKAMAEGLLERQ